MASIITRSQSNRAALGYGGTRDSHHGCTADKSAAIASNSYMKPLRSISSTLLNICHKELRWFYRQKVVRTDSTKVYLIEDILQVSTNQNTSSSTACTHWVFFMIGEVHLWRRGMLKYVCLLEDDGLWLWVVIQYTMMTPRQLALVAHLNAQGNLSGLNQHLK